MKLNNHAMLKRNGFFKIFLLLSLLYIAFQTKPWGSVSGAIFSGDDHSYYGYISSLVNDFDLDFSNNQLSGHSGVSPITGKIVVGHPIGTSILLMPFYIIAKPLIHILNWTTSSPYNQKHTLFFMFMCGGIIIYSYLGCYLLFRAISILGIDAKITTVSTMLSVWATILPAYIFRRPILSHAPEFFLISLAIFLFVKWNNDKSINTKQLLTIAFICGLIIITRWNNIHVIGIMLYWLFMNNKLSIGTTRTKIFVFLGFLAIVFLVFFLTQSLAWKYFVGSFFTLFPLNKGASISEIFSKAGLLNLSHIFIGVDWGITYTMLPMLIGLIGFLWLNPISVNNNRLLDRIIYFISFSLPFVLVLSWRRQADYYGYRYLLSLLPFSAIGLAFFIDKACKISQIFKKSLIFLTIIILIFNFLLMLPFEYQESTNLEWGKSVMGGEGFVNNAYTVNAIKFYFSASAKKLLGLFTRGFLGAYVFAAIYLFFPGMFLKLSTIDPKIKQYYSVDTFEKAIVLLYPFLVIVLLYLAHILIAKIDKE